jgi:hypothetical protein
VRGEIGVNSETKKRIEALRQQLRENPALKCSKCNTNIHEALTGKYETDYGVLCKRCFSEYLGEEIEKHPIRAAPLEKASK